MDITVMSDSIQYACIARTYMGIDTFGVFKRYNIAWPENSPEQLKHEILRVAFNDSVDDFYGVTDNFLDDLMLFDDDTLIRAVVVDSLDYNNWYSYYFVDVAASQSGRLQTFAVYYETYMRYAPHGMHGASYVTFDTAEWQVVRLSDLVDTNMLRNVLPRALEDLIVNKEALDNVYSTDIPITTNFYIDSTLSTINLVYQPYEISSYSFGIQEIVLPIYWLSKHVELTPYAKKLFGPESYLRDKERKTQKKQR